MNNRIERFLKYMEDEGIKKAVILKKENINYFLGKYFMSFSVLVFEEQPYLYVGKLDKDGNVVGEVLVGAQPYAAFEAVINKYLE